jgi:hypothetical protein
MGFKRYAVAGACAREQPETLHDALVRRGTSPKLHFSRSDEAVPRIISFFMHGKERLGAHGN